MQHGGSLRDIKQRPLDCRRCTRPEPREPNGRPEAFFEETTFIDTKLVIERL